MVTGTWSVIRTAERDDAAALIPLYDPALPRTFILDGRRELQFITQDDLCELLGRALSKSDSLYAVENMEGLIRGVCALRLNPHETSYSEIQFALIDTSDYHTPLATEAMAFVKRMAFTEKRLNKIMAQCLSNETDYQELLVREGFEYDGSQREVVYTHGHYFDVDTYSFYRSSYVPMA